MTADTVLEKIREKAIAKWGEEKWFVEIVRAYVKIAQASGEEKATPVNRRKQIHRLFYEEDKSCTADTLFRLLACVDCEIQLLCTHKTVERF